jgi:hypothetical protein
MGWVLKKLKSSDYYEFRLTTLIAIHAFLAIVYGCCEWVYTLSIRSVLTDFGASYHAVQLINAGLMPYRDFGYSYGGFGLILVDSYHRIFGLSVFSHAMLMYVGIALCFLLIYGFLLKSKLHLTTCSIILGTSLYYFSAMWTPVFMIESVFITAAIVALYFRCHALALVASSTAFLIRPSISAYLIAMIVCLLVYRAYTQRSWKSLTISIAPAALGTLLIVGLIYVWFGLPGVVSSLFPASSLAAYKNYDFGFHNLWRLFINKTGVVNSVVGVIAGKQLVLVLFFFVVIRTAYMQIRHRKASSERLFQVGLGISILYLLFMVTMYGNPITWLNYSYLLVWSLPLGGMAWRGSEDSNPSGHASVRYGVVSLFMVLFPLFNMGTQWLGEFDHFSQVERNGNHLFVRDEYDDRIDSVLRELNESNETVFFLSWGGDATEFYPRIGTSRSWAVVAGVSKENEIEYVCNQIRESDVVVELDYIGSPTKIDAIRRALADRLVTPGNEYIIYRKQSVTK